MGASVVVWKTFALFTPVGVSMSVAQSIPDFRASSIVCSESWESIAACVITQVHVEWCVRGSDNFVGWIVVYSGVIGGHGWFFRRYLMYLPLAWSRQHLMTQALLKKNIPGAKYLSHHGIIQTVSVTSEMLE